MIKKTLDWLEWPLAAVLVSGAGLVVHAQEVVVEAPGTTVRVGPDRGAAAPRPNTDLLHTPAVAAAPAEPGYWIGLLG